MLEQQLRVKSKQNGIPSICTFSEYNEQRKFSHFSAHSLSCNKIYLSVLCPENNNNNNNKKKKGGPTVVAALTVAIGARR